MAIFRFKVGSAGGVAMTACAAGVGGGAATAFGIVCGVAHADKDTAIAAIATIVWILIGNFPTPKTRHHYRD